MISVMEAMTEKKPISQIRVVSKREERKGPFHCVWGKGNVAGFNGRDEIPQDSCKKIGCPGEFAKMPPMFEGAVLLCYLDEDTGKSCSDVLSEMGIKTDQLFVTYAAALAESMWKRKPEKQS